MSRTRIGVLAALLAIAGFFPAIVMQPAQSQSENPPDLNFNELITSTVKVWACNSLRVSRGPVTLTSFGNAGDECWTGSGTVIRPDGMILTNSHVAVDNTQREPLWVLIGQTVTARTEPQKAFIGRTVLFSSFRQQSFSPDAASLDLAVVVPAFHLDGTPIQPGEVAMRPLPMAEAESANIGDELYNIGYPGIGGQLITITQGAVAGFEPDPLVPQLGLVGWMKTDATVAGGNSGGTTIGEDGLMIGVPTEIGATDEREGFGTFATINHIRPIPEGFTLLTETGTGEGIPPSPSAGGETPVDNGSTTDANVTVTGSIVSADSGQPIPGAWFIVLKPGVPVSEFLAGNQEAVYSFATSNANGEFQLKNPVARDQGYGVLVIARGFLNMNEDNKVLATAEAPAVVTLPPIQMAAQR